MTASCTVKRTNWVNYFGGNIVWLFNIGGTLFVLYVDLHFFCIPEVWFIDCNQHPQCVWRNMNIFTFDFGHSRCCILN